MRTGTYGKTPVSMYTDPQISDSADYYNLLNFISFNPIGEKQNGNNASRKMAGVYYSVHIDYQKKKKNRNF